MVNQTLFAHDLSAAQRSSALTCSVSGAASGALPCLCGYVASKEPRLCYTVCCGKEPRAQLRGPVTVRQWIKAAMSQTIPRRNRGALANIRSRWSEYRAADTAGTFQLFHRVHVDLTDRFKPAW